MFSSQQKEAIYQVIKKRRDIRSFLRDSIPIETLYRILRAAHYAPSVGFMQPWNFIIISSDEVKKQLAWAADKERRALSIHYEDDSNRAETFLSLKVEGLIDAPYTICVTCDPTRGGSHVLGRNSIQETDIMSTACAIQNMMLAACAEGLATGWVSFYKKNDIRDILAIPPHIEPVALLSIGYTEHYPTKPILETANWEKRRNINTVIFYEKWGKHPTT
ncbi:5,6-dimethylbenzimidazole synthase [Metabacillus sp. HB246100]